MTTLDITNDFSLFTDHLAPVTLHHHGSTRKVTVETACREFGTTREAAPSEGAVLQTDATWPMQLPPGEAAPRVGDVAVDQQKNRWTILEVKHLAALGRWKCATRELRLAHGCEELVDVERAVWDDLGSGPEIVDWVYVCHALPAKIQLAELLLDTSTDPPTKQLLFDIILSESLPLEPDDRFTAEDGATYRLQSLEQANRIDALPIAHAVREEM